MRNCRINVSVITLIAMAISVGVIAYALATSAWQVADLSTYPMIRRIYFHGLVQNCIEYVQQTNNIVSNLVGGNPAVYDPSFNNPNLVMLPPAGQGLGWMQSQVPIDYLKCAIIPYSTQFYGSWQAPQQLPGIDPFQQTQMQHVRWFVMNDPQYYQNYPSINYQQYGEDWRLVTLVALSVACGFGFFAFLAELTGSCLDCFKINLCLQAASTTAFALMLISLLSGITGIIVFATKTGYIEDIYILEQHAVAKFQWGRSFWFGIGGVAASGAALLFNLMHMLLVCAASRNRHKEPKYSPPKYSSPRNNTREVIIYKDRLPAKRNNSLEEMYNRLPVVIESDRHGMLMEEVKKKDWSAGF